MRVQFEAGDRLLIGDRRGTFAVLSPVTGKKVRLKSAHVELMRGAAVGVDQGNVCHHFGRVPTSYFYQIVAPVERHFN